MKNRIKSNVLLSTIVIVVVILALAGVTTALLTASSGPLENTFTIGEVEIALTETTGADYQLIPGKEIAKNPKVTVAGESEDCWLFIKVSKTQYFDDYIEYTIDDGWTRLGGFDGVYYREVIESVGGTTVGILKNNVVTVKDNLTEEKMSAITAPPVMTFKAYAVQSHSIGTAYDAWMLILEEGGE